MNWKETREVLQNKLEEANSKIAELRGKLAESEAKNWRILTDCAGHTGENMELRAKLAESQQEIETYASEYEMLKNKLAEAEFILNSKLVAAKHLQAEAESELAKFRAAVPEDVYKLVSKLEEAYNVFYAFNAAGAADIAEAEQDLLALIGALILLSKEERRKEIVDAVKYGLTLATPYMHVSPLQRAEEYADRILKGE